MSSGWRAGVITGLRAVRVPLVSAVILWRRGLVHPRRPWADLRVLRIARRAGPFPAAIDYHARFHPDRPAVADDLGVLGYGELDSMSNALARGLRARPAGSAAVVALLARGRRDAVVAMIAAAKAGCRLVLLNTGFSGPQLCDVLARERVTVLLRDAEFARVTSEVPESVRQYVFDGDDAPSRSVRVLIEAHRTAAVPLPATPAGLVLLTSGTTGTPKGALRERMSPFLSAQMLDRMPIAPGGAMLVLAPLFHATGLGLALLGLAMGKTIVFGPPAFDAAATLARAVESRADTVVLVPTMLQRVLDLGPETLERADTSALRVIACGGSALSPGSERRTAEAFGPVLHNMYGATEVAVAAVATPADLRHAPGTAGRPPIGCRIALYRRDGRLAGPGEPGTIFVANASRFAGYTDGGDKRRRGEFVSTGDIGHLDHDGLLFIDGREDDMIVSGGENVFPAEVENLLLDRADILDAAVVGVPDRDFGRRLRAYVVPTPGREIDPQEVRDHVKSRLARYKTPREVVTVERIPRNAAGKVVRRELDAAAGEFDDVGDRR
ncbi:AMP-binding protein [Nocardia takedensis]